MPTFNKLVRDKIPEICIANGQTPVTHVLSDSEYKQELIKKLQEEVAEYIADDNAEELADILEVLLALAGTLQVSPEELERIRAEKAERRGAFAQRIFLERAK